MSLYEALRLALQTVWSHKLRSFFTLLGIIVSVAFLVAVVAVIQGMNAYVRERLAGAIVGVNAFQIRRDPIQVGFIDDEQWKQIQRRPIIAPEDVDFIERAVPDAEAVALQSGWPTPMADVQWRNRTTGDVFVFGVTAPYVLVQDYTFAAGAALTDIDVQQRRYVAVLGYDVAEKLFDNIEAAVGRTIRVRGIQLVVKGVIAKKGTVLGQSWDGFVMLPLSTFESMYGRRQTMVISVKMPAADGVGPAMLRAEEAMRIAHRLRPGSDNDFTIDTGEGLIAFWGKLTRVIFTVVPAVVVIGVVVGGIVIMNIMLMSERAHARNRRPQGAGGRAPRHPAPVLRRSIDAVDPGRHRRHRGGVWTRGTGGGDLAAPGAGHAVVDRSGHQPGTRGGRLVRRLPGAARGAPRSDRSTPPGIDETPFGA